MFGDHFSFSFARYSRRRFMWHTWKKRSKSSNSWKIVMRIRMRWTRSKASTVKRHWRQWIKHRQHTNHNISRTIHSRAHRNRITSIRAAQMKIVGPVGTITAAAAAAAAIPQQIQAAPATTAYSIHSTFQVDKLRERKPKQKQ